MPPRDERDRVVAAQDPKPLAGIPRFREIAEHQPGLAFALFCDAFEVIQKADAAGDYRKVHRLMPFLAWMQGIIDDVESGRRAAALARRQQFREFMEHQRRQRGWVGVLERQYELQRGARLRDRGLRRVPRARGAGRPAARHQARASSSADGPDGEPGEPPSGRCERRHRKPVVDRNRGRR